MTAALEGSEWPAARSGRTLPPGKTRYLFYWRLGGPQGRSGREENLVPTARSSVAIPTELPGPLHIRKAFLILIIEANKRTISQLYFGK